MVKYKINCIIFVLSKIMKFIGLLLLCCVVGSVSAQAPAPIPPMKMGKNDTIKTYVTMLDGQPVPWIMYGEVKIVDTRIFKSQADRDAYVRLEYNVKKVWPYAQFAGQRYQQLQRDLALTADKHKQKELVAACNNQIKDLFKREVENLTISQGEVLIKLIDRQTGNTSYDLVKQLKGGLDAFMLQSVARLFGHNLKETYDTDEDRDIETIIQKEGYDSVRN
jgi:hypothetical protein